MDALLPHQVPAREAVLREARALTAPPPHASDLQDVESLPRHYAVEPSHAERIEPMLLFHAESMAVELRQSAASRLDG